MKIKTIERSEGMAKVFVDVDGKEAIVEFAPEEREGSDITLNGEILSTEDELDLWLEIDTFAREAVES